MQIRSKNKWPKKEIILFLQKVEMYLSAGLVINRILHIVEQDQNKRQSLSIQKIRGSVESGILFSASLEKYIGISKSVTSLIENGELSGNLSKSISISIDLLEKEDELFKKCINALIYPAVIACFALLLTIGLIQGVVSQIIPLLKSLDVKLPIMTKVVILISQIIKDYGLYILVVIILIVATWIFSMRRFLTFRKIIHISMINIPIFGKVIYNYNLSIFLQSCGLLIESGVSVYDAYTKTIKTVSLIPLSVLLNDHSVNVESGISLSKIFANKRNPAFVSSLIGAGEVSGTLGKSIIRTGLILDKEIDLFLKRMTALIEPIMMVGMGLIVGTIALSIMVPIYNISSSLQR